MDSNRIRRGEQKDRFDGRGTDDQTPRPERPSVAHDVSGPKSEATEGQLGPDELSEPEEVVMNLEAKRHH